KREGVPNKNEDTALVDIQHDVFAVCDGIGGAAAGDVASRRAVESIQDSISNAPQTVEMSPNRAVDWVEDVLRNAHFAVNDEAKRLRNDMGTTAVVVKILRTANMAVIGHVGDSRTYALYDDGELGQLTLDDGIARYHGTHSIA